MLLWKKNSHFSILIILILSAKYAVLNTYNTIIFLYYYYFNIQDKSNIYEKLNSVELWPSYVRTWKRKNHWSLYRIQQSQSSEETMTARHRRLIISEVWLLLSFTASYSARPLVANNSPRCRSESPEDSREYRPFHIIYGYNTRIVMIISEVYNLLSIHSHRWLNL